ncbi:MAG: flippase-like domain-containing protein [Thermodesulfovibrionales bacterium]|nr:flippase-like domain-containing protein [Thermodesulfovibrionales bacterium]
MVLQNKSAKSLFFFILKLTISITLLYMLLKNIGIDAIIGYLRVLHPLFFISAVGLYIFSIFISSIRWSLFIEQKIKLKTLFSIYMIGSFFNICLPGIISGDGVRIYYLSKELKKGNSSSVLDNRSLISQKPNVVAVASTFMDRYLGLLALMIIGIITFPFGFKYLEESSKRHLFIWLVPFLFIFLIMGSLLLFKLNFFKRFEFFSNMGDYLKKYSSRRNIMVEGFIYSLFIQILSIFSAYLLSIGMSLEVPILTLLMYMPLIIVASLVPLSVSGIGVREVAFVFFLSSVGISPTVAIALSMAWYLSIVIASLGGLLVYLRFRS